MIQAQAIQELDAALNTIARTASTRQWVRSHLEERLETGFELDVSSSGDTDAETVCILKAGLFEYHVPVENVPEWINREADLPVEGQPT